MTSGYKELLAYNIETEQKPSLVKQPNSGLIIKSHAQRYKHFLLGSYSRKHSSAKKSYMCQTVGQHGISLHHGYPITSYFQRHGESLSYKVFGTWNAVVASAPWQWNI